MTSASASSVVEGEIGNMQGKYKGTTIYQQCDDRSVWYRGLHCRTVKRMYQVEISSSDTLGLKNVVRPTLDSKVHDGKRWQLSKKVRGKHLSCLRVPDSTASAI
ncbi:hypothetical protein J6590_020160 [Homalodisca vitripennis]|nr:hypothetical protein J6590_020160 [Homalodisca vitripennis]